MGTFSTSGRFTLREMLTAVAVLSLGLLAALLVRQNVVDREQAAAAARTTRLLIHEARLGSIFKGIHHFVVFDPTAHSLSLYADAGSVDGRLDADDPRVALRGLAEGVVLSLPAGSELPPVSGLGGPPVTARVALTTTPAGHVRGAEAASATAKGGVIVFSDGSDAVAALGYGGRDGALRSFGLIRGRWKEL